MKNYKRIVIEANGSTDVLKTVEEALPEPKPGEVRVRALAAGVGFADVMAQHGGYPLAPKLPFTPGYDFAGIVDQLGEGVTGIMEGQYVAALRCPVACHGEFHFVSNLFLLTKGGKP
jgi:NADPH:quinone reductase-like Zn-dependent oxidoreductase